MEKLYRYIFFFLLIIISIIIVVYHPCTIEENFFKNEQLETEDIIIHNSKIKYNLGDVFLIPKIANVPHFMDYVEHPNYRDIIKEYPGSIVDIYETLRESPEEYIPNIDKIQKSVDIYIDQHKTSIEFMEKIKFISKPNVLCVHLRSGDKGHITDIFKELINKLQFDYEYLRTYIDRIIMNKI